MNCDRLLEITGWKCEPSGHASVRAIAPFSLGSDGRHAAFYLAQPTEETFVLTDAGETAMHAAQCGVELSKPRLESLNGTAGVAFAKFSGDWSITADGPIEDAELALWDAVKLALSLSFSTPKWMPKLDHIRFRALVEKTLIAAAGRERVKGAYRVQGISGHWIEFPLSLQPHEDDVWLIEPIALSSGERVDWGRVHQAYGKLSDAKQAQESVHRLVVLEDGAPEVEFGRAATLLAQTAQVTTLRRLSTWATERLAA
jgi:hypothetical protein